MTEEVTRCDAGLASDVSSVSDAKRCKLSVASDAMRFGAIRCDAGGAVANAMQATQCDAG